MPQPLTRERCLERADECRREADRADSDSDRRIYGRLVEYWQAMARAVPFQRPNPQPPHPMMTAADKPRRH